MVELPPPAVGAWDFPRSAASVLLMTKFGEQCGVTGSEVLRGAGLSRDGIGDPDAQVDAHQELAVVRNLVTLLADRRALGLEVGSRYRVTTFGIFGFACVSSPTLRDAVDFALRYFDLSFAFCIPTVEVEGESIRLRLHDERIPGDVRPFLVERDLAAIYTVLGDLLGGSVPLRTLDLRAQEPVHSFEFVRMFGIRPAFGAAENAGTFDRAYLDQPLPQANEHTVAICEAQCRDLVARRRARTGIAQRVRDRLIRFGGTDTGVAMIASELTMSERTLRRRLDEAGTSYRGLLDEVRQALAEEMLATRALSVSDVAIRLGYAEATSFIYAFKRWTGVTPATYQRRFR